MTAGASAGAAAAAAEQRRRLLEEEEEMTHYTPDELKDDWEFKIVRANTNAFRKPAKLQRLQDEEARAGWTMLEKLDDARVRFRRPRSARANDALLPPDVDPYRSYWGLSPLWFAVLVVAITLACVGLFAAVIILWTQAVG
jgi:hypothetical protein